MIIEESYVSTSDVKDKTSTVIKWLNKVWTKILLSKNKPVWVFLSVNQYNNLKKSAFLKEKASEEDIKAYKQSFHWKNWVEAFGFLKKLK